MPDWFYRTVAQPALFRLPDRTARSVALGVIGVLGASRMGRAVIDFLGHMHADPRLAVQVGGTTLASPFGLGWRLDPECRATQGLARFGVGAIERRESRDRFVVREDERGLRDGPGQAGRGKMRDPGGEVVRLLRTDRDDGGGETVHLPSGEVLSVVAWDTASPEDERQVKTWPGVVLQVGTRCEDGGWRVPAGLPMDLPAQVRGWRSRLGDRAPLIVAGGVAGPADGLALIDAGASLVLIDAGLVFSGPGLVKRCNAALVAQRAAVADPVETAGGRGGLMRRSWFWALALGLALAGGGLLALVLAFGRVLLPYDEQFLGLTAALLQRNWPRLHAFMAHDRGTLAGVMLGLGWFYAVLAWHGLRRDVEGAKTAVVASASAGFASFGSFLGFGYFDTLHAFVAAVLLQFTVQIMVGVDGDPHPPAGGMDHEDASWRRAQWGQLCWVIHAVGLVLAGTVILAIGMTDVFVSEDLSFLCLSLERVQALGARVVAVVAHDRASLGGLLWASGVAMLLPVLWCHQRGARWLWWAIAGLGLPAYGATLVMHAWVGYTDWRHILPAVLGLVLWMGGLGLSAAYLRRR